MEEFVTPVIKKENGFHFIRILCCLIVIYEHTVGLSNLSFVCFNIRNVAVAVFFILSGFWVSFSYLRCNNIKEFYWKRIKKIFPQYLTVVILSSILLCFFSKLSFLNYFSSSNFWKYLVANILTLNFIQPTLPEVFSNCAMNGAVNGSLWTIKIELGFYLLLPFLFLIIKNLKSLGRIIIFLLIYILSIIYGPFCIILGLSDSFRNQLPAYMNYFTSGIILCLYWKQFISIKNKILFPAIILGVVEFLFKFYFLFPLCLTVVIFWIAVSCPWLSKITKNDYSYSLYLVHFPIIQILNTTNIFILYPALGVLLVVGFSFFISYFLNILHNFFNK